MISITRSSLRGITSWTYVLPALVLLGWNFAGTAFAEGLAPGTVTAWGRVAEVSSTLGTIRLDVENAPVEGRLALPVPFPNITSASIKRGARAEFLHWSFNADATRVEVELPANVQGRQPVKVDLETAEKTQQFPDGRIVFSALDASVDGTAAKLETHPGNHRIGFWTRTEDSVWWSYKPTRWGRYDVECAFSGDGGAGTELEFEVAGQKLTAQRPATGSWYRYTTLPVGRFYLAKSDPFQVRVRGLKKTGAAVMNLKSVTLRPAPEGDPILQDAAGLLTLHARDAITHSVLMRYEPQTNKLCLGYWANAADRAQWVFQVREPGEYQVELWQGCGKGHGGSEVEVLTGETSLRLVVEETGHFQNFIPRKLGVVRLEAGERDLWVKPVRKQGGAVMDIQKIVLTPAKAR